MNKNIIYGIWVTEESYDKNSITENGYSVEQSISGYWRLMKDGEVIYDDSACEDLNEDKETAEAFFIEYLKELYNN